MKKKTEQNIRIIILNFGIILIAGVFVGWVLLNYPETTEIKGIIPFAPQFVLIAIVFFLLGFICYREKKALGRSG